MQQGTFSQFKQKQRGFTLVELMVSVALFSIVVTVSMGTLITMIDANNKAQALYSVMTNISFAVDSMTRNIRTGNAYFCTNDESQISTTGMFSDYSAHQRDCTSASGGRILLFTREADGKRAGYRYNQTDKSIEQFVKLNPDGSQVWLRITAADVIINKLEFNAYDTANTSAGANNFKQARVAIYIEGSVAGQRSSGAAFMIQTSVPQQIIDY